MSVTGLSHHQLPPLTRRLFECERKVASEALQNRTGITFQAIVIYIGVSSFAHAEATARAVKLIFTLAIGAIFSRINYEELRRQRDECAAAYEVCFRSLMAPFDQGMITGFERPVAPARPAALPAPVPAVAVVPAAPPAPAPEAPIRGPVQEAAVPRAPTPPPVPVAPQAAAPALPPPPQPAAAPLPARPQARFSRTFASPPVLPRHIQEMETRIDDSHEVQNKLEGETRRANFEIYSPSHERGFRYRKAAEAYFLRDSRWGVTSQNMGVLDVGMCRYASEQCPAKGEHVALQFNVKMGNCEYSVKAFGIFDAHFGPLAAQFVKNNLQEALSQLLQHHNSERLTDRGVRNALKLVFVELNRRFLIENCNLKNEATGEYVANQGATAIMTMILDKKVWTAGMGGVAILFREGNALCLNREAKPGSDAFAKGVAKRGGTIQNGLVEGEVSTTRGIGFAYLNGVISSRPKVTVNISGGDLLLLSTEFSKRCSLQELVPVLNATKGISARELAANLVYSVHPPAEASTHVIVVRGDEEESYVPVDPPPPSPTQAQQQYYDGAKPEELQRHFPPASPRASFPDVVSVGDEKSVRGDAVGEAAAPAGRGSPVLSDSYVRLTEKELRGNSEDSEEY